MRARLVVGVLTVGLCGVGLSEAQPVAPSPDLSSILTRVGDYVERYYARAQSLIAREDVERLPIRSDRSADGTSTRYQYHVRLEWVPLVPGAEPTATMIRELTRINGRPPKPTDKPRCSQPTEQWPEPLIMFLSQERDFFDFKLAGPARVDGRAVMKLDFHERPHAEPIEPQTEWSKVDGESCVSIRQMGLLAGRAWAAVDTGEVLRLETHYAGPIEIPVPEKERRDWGASRLVLDRWDQDIRYKRVTFSEPTEDMVVPERIETVSLFRGLRGMRTTQRFADYRRFIADSRIVQ